MKVSVCMAVYNGEKYIEEQLASIMPQLGADDELVISDNCSTDRTLECIERFQDGKIKVVRYGNLLSQIYNFENALKYASGDVIFLADQDDIWMPNKVEVMKSMLETRDLVCSDCQVVDAEGKVLRESYFAMNGCRKGFIKNLIRNNYLGCCVAFRRRLLKIALPFPRKIVVHDFWIAGLAEIFGTTGFCHEKLMKYRRHGENMSTTTEKSTNPLWRKIAFRVTLLLALLKRSIQYKFSSTVAPGK